MSSKVIFSVIIPCRVETPYLLETLHRLRQQSFKRFEIIVVTDAILSDPSPAVKRNFGARKAKGTYLAFLDDDSYPDQNWLKNALNSLTSRQNLAAVCGPCLTPPADSLAKQASGLVWSSFLGSGGAGTYRNRISAGRYVDDYPSVNLIVRKSDFLKVGGFNTRHWPGEDTILCLDLTSGLHHQIYYDPSVIVYHHRRDVLVPHLKQISRYALHRGNFARIYPKTSLRIGYLLPSLFLLYCLTLPLFLNLKSYFIYPLYLYVFLLLLTFAAFIYRRQPLLTSLLATSAIPVTHLYYGFLFLIGFFTPTLKFTAHSLNRSKSAYQGG